MRVSELDNFIGVMRPRDHPPPHASYRREYVAENASHSRGNMMLKMPITAGEYLAENASHIRGNILLKMQVKIDHRNPVR